MPNTPDPVPARAVALRERKAYLAGRQDEHWRTCDPRHVDVIVRERYPLPQIERPRVVTITLGGKTDCDARVMHGRVQWHPADFTAPLGWNVGALDTDRLDAASLRALADLLDNPTELVDDDGSTPEP